MKLINHNHATGVTTYLDGKRILSVTNKTITHPKCFSDECIHLQEKITLKRKKGFNNWIDTIFKN